MRYHEQCKVIPLGSKKLSRFTDFLSVLSKLWDDDHQVPGGGRDHGFHLAGASQEKGCAKTWADLKMRRVIKYRNINFWDTVHPLQGFLWDGFYPDDHTVFAPCFVHGTFGF
jgi:hypothetical protein